MQITTSIWDDSLLYFWCIYNFLRFPLSTSPRVLGVSETSVGGKASDEEWGELLILISSLHPPVRGGGRYNEDWLTWLLPTTFVLKCRLENLSGREEKRGMSQHGLFSLSLCCCDWWLVTGLSSSLCWRENLLNCERRREEEREKGVVCSSRVGTINTQSLPAWPPSWSLQGWTQLSRQNYQGSPQQKWINCVKIILLKWELTLNL